MCQPCEGSASLAYMSEPSRRGYRGGGGAGVMSFRESLAGERFGLVVSGSRGEVGVGSLFEVFL